MRRRRGWGVLLAALACVGAIVGATAQAAPAAAARLGGTAAASPAAGRPGGVRDFGNPDGRFPVPAAGQAVSTTLPNHVIGNGDAASCTSNAVVQAVAEGGIITFDCGLLPVTILMTATANVANTEHQVVLDGGGLVTLSGGGARRILFSDTCAGRWSTGDCVNQPYPQIVVQNVTFEDGYAGAKQIPCTANEPQCWYGGVDGGGAIYAEGGQFKAVNSRFIDNGCYGYGPDLGGGAIRALAQYQNRPVYITGDTFSGGRCSNGAALSSIDVQWDILNSVFTGNEATGWGANPPASGTPGGGSGGAIYNDGTDYSTLIAGTVMTDNTAREGGGAIFYVVDSGSGTLALYTSYLDGNPSAFQDAPGIYDLVDGDHETPVSIGSVDN
jgi:hypothetical protein